MDSQALNKFEKRIGGMSKKNSNFEEKIKTEGNEEESK